MATTKIKCPVEGIIDLDRLPGVPASRVESLIDAPEVQRLRRVRQLGFTEYVYPGATHTRFAHSLGAFQGAQRTLSRLRVVTDLIDDDWHVATSLACLLHDLGHGPFSHTFESITGQPHEERTLELVREGPRVPDLLEQIGCGQVDRVSQLLKGRMEDPRLGFLADLVSSALDCDRMDYLRRDALHTGASYGSFDRDWLIREMEPTSDGAAIVVIEKGRTAVEQYLIGRYHMFQNVYLHKTSRGFEGAFRMLCQRLVALGVDELPTASRAFRMLFEDVIGPADFLSLTDQSFLVELEWLLDHRDPTVRGLAQALHHRRPLRLQPLSASDEETARTQAERQESARKQGLDIETAVWIDTAADVPYRPYAPDLARKGLRIRRRDGSLVDVTELSPTLAALSERVAVQRLYWLDPGLD
jgi:HD superfamily phosphohydrolase